MQKNKTALDLSHTKEISFHFVPHSYDDQKVHTSGKYKALLKNGA
jgi:hypothetical protein